MHTYRLRKGILRIIVVLLISGLFGMFALYVDNNKVHPLEMMEPANPFDVSDVPLVDLAEIHEERTLNVSVDGKIVMMKLEDYVFCVLAAEMPASFSPEALKAQAVAARTLAVHKIMFGGCTKYAGADVCDESGNCQAFLSIDEIKGRWKGSYNEYEAKLRKAVAETAGKIITYGNTPILVLYHASSAGYTESVENVYSQALPYLRSVASPGEDKVTTLEAREELERKWFCNAVNKAYPKARLSAASLEKQISVTGRFPSGRVKSIKLGAVSISGVQFRRLVDIRSANFTIGFDKYSVIVTTEGYGHGVGMSQNGAEAMAREGNNYIDILTYYYSGVKVVDMT